MKRHLRNIGIAVLVLLVGAAGATALAARQLHGHGMMKKHLSAMIDDALDAAQATPAQRDAIHAARDRAFAAVAAAHEGRGADMQQAVALFESDRLDPRRVAALRAEHEATAKQVGDAIQQAMVTAHDVLSPSQRKAVADYLRGHRPGRNAGALRGEMMKRFASSRLDAALDAVKASDAQRTAIHGARDQLFLVIEENRPQETHRQLADRALALFEADRIDPAAVAALRADMQARKQKIGDAVVQAIEEVHDALTPAQRQTLVEYVRAQHAKFREHHGGFGGPGFGPGEAPGSDG